MALLIIRPPSQTNDDRPLVFHTLPAKNEATKTPEVPVQESQHASDDIEMSTSPVNNEKGSKISPSTATIPRLLTVVEIVKKEYIKVLEAGNSSVLLGLHQYNELGILESSEPPVEAEQAQARADALLLALEGKN